MIHYKKRNGGLQCGQDKRVWNTAGSNFGDGYNRTEDKNKVTCKLCLRQINKKKVKRF